MSSICSPNWFSSSLYLQEQLVCSVTYSSSNAWSLIMKLCHFLPAITLFPCEGEKSGDLWELVQLKCTSRANTVQLCLLRFLSPSSDAPPGVVQHAMKPLSSVELSSLYPLLKYIFLSDWTMISSCCLVAGLRAHSSDCVFEVPKSMVEFAERD